MLKPGSGFLAGLNEPLPKVSVFVGEMLALEEATVVVEIVESLDVVGVSLSSLPLTNEADSSS